MREPNKNRTHINYLRKFRRARGLKRRDVAAILGVRDLGTITRWETGKAMPSVMNLLRLSALYRTFADALFPEMARDLKNDLQLREKRAAELARLSGAPRTVDIESIRINSNIESKSNRRRPA